MKRSNADDEKRLVQLEEDPLSMAQLSPNLRRVSGRWAVFFRINAACPWAPLRGARLWRGSTVLAADLVRQKAVIPPGRVLKDARPFLFALIADGLADQLLFDDRKIAARFAYRSLPRLRMTYPECGLQICCSHIIHPGGPDDD